MRIPGVLNFLLLTASGCLSAGVAYTQSPAEDSILYNKTVYNTISLYHRAIGEQSGLFNGSQYAQYTFPFEEQKHPFFRENKPVRGSITYDDILYEDVNLQYDEIQGVVLMQDSSRRIQLLNQRVAGFNLFGNVFVRLVKDSLHPVLAATGFYNMLYIGNTSLLKKEDKLIREDVSSGAMQRFIDTDTYYYIRKDNAYYPVKSKSSLPEIFKDHKKEVRQFIKKNNLSYRKDRDNMLIQTTAYYDQLTK